MIFLLLHAIVPATLLATSPNCWPEPRLYHPPAGEFTDLAELAAQRIKLRRIAERLPKERVLSPNGAYAFHLSLRPQVGSSGNTKATLLVFTEQAEVLQVEADDIQNMLDVKWLNEKLIGFRLWIGRRAGVDVVLDVERDKVVHTEVVADGRLLWEQAKEYCAANPKDANCTRPCVALE